MREFKFRAWDKTTNKMIYVSDVHKEDYCIVIYLDGAVEDIAFERGDDLSEIVELMQYTGLKDNNGKEIYEGDIVEWDDPGYASIEGENDLMFINGKARSAIEYDEEDACFDPLYWYYCDINEKDRKSIMVIGNIYENPELLE